MDFEVPVAHGAFRGSIPVPASKSVWQRALVLRALADTPVAVRAHAASAAPTGDDVRALDTSLTSIGGWHANALGADRITRRADLGLGATGFRFMLPLAALRPRGARTLVTGGRGLLVRPHRPLLNALVRRGVRLKRRHSGAIRVLGGGYTGGRVVLDGSLSSQYASALLLAAPRTGGIELCFAGPCVSRPYLGLTLDALRAFNIECEAEGLDGSRGTVRVAAGVPARDVLDVPPDASAAAGLFAAAALTQSAVRVPGLTREGAQADLALLGILERMGARVTSDDAGVQVEGTGARLASPGPVDLTDAPDLLPVVAALAAAADGRTRIHGVGHARGKESDRVATSAAAIRALGGRAEAADDALTVTGGALEGGRVDVAGDHRIAFAFGALGLAVPGVRLSGAQAVGKSHPGFLDDLARIAAGS
ncbi:MAG: 3-phosphoshikimate 1-carboxyvinyltransferase [Planctomycetota bacterium]|nr:3-phosphoshikimate 1-carboxyvinyltransferase [Planctomycetota bacterium]